MKNTIDRFINEGILLEVIFKGSNGETHYNKHVPKEEEESRLEFKDRSHKERLLQFPYNLSQEEYEKRAQKLSETSTGDKFNGRIVDGFVETATNGNERCIKYAVSSLYPLGIFKRMERNGNISVFVPSVRQSFPNKTTDQKEAERAGWIRDTLYEVVTYVCKSKKDSEIISYMIAPKFYIDNLKKARDLNEIENDGVWPPKKKIEKEPESSTSDAPEKKEEEGEGSTTETSNTSTEVEVSDSESTTSDKDTSKGLTIAEALKLLKNIE